MYSEIHIPAVLNPESISSLNAQLLECEKQNTRFVVLKGGDTVFCNGLDLAWVAYSEDTNHQKDMQHYAGFLKKLQRGNFISIALVKGLVSGGGMGVVCACDHVLAHESSTFSLPEGLLGLIPGMILPSLLNRLSPQQVKKMVYAGKKYSAAEALEFSIIDEITNDHERSLAEAIRSMKSCKPAAVADIKEIIFDSNANKDELALRGMNLLNKRLQEPEIKQRLKDIADFM